LHQSTAGFIEDKLTDLRPDVVLLAATQRLYDLRSVLKILEPRTIMLHHFDKKSKFIIQVFIENF
jgi:hypothetical protein